jgi:hypothetical protein
MFGFLGNGSAALLPQVTTQLTSEAIHAPEILAAITATPTKYRPIFTGIAPALLLFTFRYHTAPASETAARPTAAAAAGGVRPIFRSMKYSITKVSRVVQIST